MIEHAFRPDPFGRDACDSKEDDADEGRVSHCGRPEAEHMDETHGLKVQLATALRERDEAREAARDLLNGTAKAESERDALRAEIADWHAVEAECGAVDCHCGCHVHAQELAALASGGDRG